ncbi:MAG TPA: MarR family transcriptional regulator [Alphaproteobacteria bacterium]|nr:MarR family transcriptional regulator [Alphaproteobacteria bacterium]
MFDLASYLPYLVNRVGVRLANAFGKELAAFGVTLPMWRVMAALRDRRSSSVGRLSEATSIEVSTLSRLLAAMDRRGLVRRQRASADARSVIVELSEAGKHLTQRIIPKALRYQEIALRDFDGADATALKAMLVRVHENIAALEEEAPEGVERARAGASGR